MFLRKTCSAPSLSCPPLVALTIPEDKVGHDRNRQLESQRAKDFCAVHSQGPCGCQDSEWFMSPPHQGAMECWCLHGSLADFPPTCVMNGVSEHLLTPARDVEEAVRKPRRCLGNADTDAVTRPKGENAAPRTWGHSQFPRSPCRAEPPSPDPELMENTLTLIKYYRRLFVE